MKKPSLQDALATKAPPIPPIPPAPAAVPPGAEAEQKDDARVVTSLRIPAADLEALKVIAARKRGMKVNDLVLEGVRHVLALHGAKS